MFIKASNSPQANVPSQKGNSSKTIIVALVVVVIILAGFAGYIEMYSQSQISSLKSQLSNANSTIASLQSQLSNANSEISSLQSQLSNDNSEISSLQSQLSNANSNAGSEISSLQSIINLQDQETWVNSQTVSQPAGSYTYWTEDAPYAGYIIVDVQSSTTSNTYVAVSWTTANGISYSSSVQVGSSGTAAFPVLPSNNVTISVGNSNLINGATETVSITYVY